MIHTNIINQLPLDEEEVKKSDLREKNKKKRYELKEEFNFYKLNDSKNLNFDDKLPHYLSNRTDNQQKLFKPWEFLKGRVSGNNTVNKSLKKYDRYDYSDVETNFEQFMKNKIK